jgi:type 1 glutamine amidotransferase
MRTTKVLLRSSILGALLVLLSPVSAQELNPARSGSALGQQGPPRIQGQNPNGMHIYVRAGLKTHPPGLHDYPQFDSGFMTDSEKAALEGFIKRGGGIVSLHDALCGPDPTYFATLVGGAKKHGEVNYTLGADILYTIVDKSNPIMEGMSGVTIFDEAFFTMTWAKDPPIHVLATVVIPGTPSAGTHKGEVVPQIWAYEHTLPGGEPARAFVWMQGHTYANFANPKIQAMLLRGIAWAAKRPVNELVDYTAR